MSIVNRKRELSLEPSNVKVSKILRASLASFRYVGRHLTIGAITSSRYAAMFSVGQQHADTMGHPGLFG